MKCLAIFVIYLSIACLISPIFSEKNWIEKELIFRNFRIKTITHYKIDASNLVSLLEIADKSCDSKSISQLKPNEYIGAIRKNDIIVVTHNLLLWFSATAKNDGRVVKSAGGLLAGVWELKYNKSTRKVFFKFSKKNTNFLQNFLLPCSTPKKYEYGARIYGGYPASKIKWTLEASEPIKLGKKFGKDIISLGKGAYSADEGLYIEFKGKVTNTGIENGFESITDTDPRPGIEGITNYVLVYRVPSNKPEVIQEVEFNTITNNFGPITTPIISLRVPFENKTNDNLVTYASNPELMPRENDINLKNVEVNKYFRNTCVKKVFFYSLKDQIVENLSKKSKFSFNRNKKELNTRTVSTPPGRGKILCIGNPKEKISFICGYPNNDYIPKEYFEEYSLSMKNNQKDKNNKFYSLDYRLTGKKGKSIIFGRGQKLILIMRYKLIDASSAVRK